MKRVLPFPGGRRNNNSNSRVVGIDAFPSRLQKRLMVQLTRMKMEVVVIVLERLEWSKSRWHHLKRKNHP